MSIRARSVPANFLNHFCWRNLWVLLGWRKFYAGRMKKWHFKQLVSCYVPRCSNEVGFFCCLGFLLPTPSALLAAKKKILENRKEGKRSEHQRSILGRPWPHISFMKGRKMLLCKGCSCTRRWVCSVQFQDHTHFLSSWFQQPLTCTPASSSHSSPLPPGSLARGIEILPFLLLMALEFSQHRMQSSSGHQLTTSRGCTSQPAWLGWLPPLRAQDNPTKQWGSWKVIFLKDTEGNSHLW